MNINKNIIHTQLRSKKKNTNNILNILNIKLFKKQ